jgi:hypothetical protein
MQTSQQTDVVDVQEDLIPMLMLWHKNKVAVLNHLLTLPEGTQATGIKEEQYILTGDTLRGFQLGITLSLMELGELPISLLAEEATTLGAQ